MILTEKEQINHYATLNPFFSTAFSALEKLATSTCSPGRYSIDGDNVFVNVLEYDTSSEQNAQMEAHRVYIDVMWMLSGTEQIAVCPLEDMTQLTSAYDATDDSLLGQIPGGCTYIQMQPGSICILFPEDGHAPGLNVAESSRVRKLIAKVRVV